MKSNSRRYSRKSGSKRRSRKQTCNKKNKPRSGNRTKNVKHKKYNKVLNRDGGRDEEGIFHFEEDIPPDIKISDLDVIETENARLDALNQQLREKKTLKDELLIETEILKDLKNKFVKLIKQKDNLELEIYNLRENIKIVNDSRKHIFRFEIIKPSEGLLEVYEQDLEKVLKDIYNLENNIKIQNNQINILKFLTYTSDDWYWEEVEKQIKNNERLQQERYAERLKAREESLKSRLMLTPPSEKNSF